MTDGPTGSGVAPLSPSPPRSGRLPLPMVLAFSGANLPVVALYVAINVYLPQFFASHIGISLAQVGAAFFTVRALDMIVDPALGVAMDGTRTRFGRYRVWLAAGAPVLMLAAATLFMAPKGVGVGYLIGWLLVLYLGYSMLLLSHSAWTATLATNYHERSRVFGIQAVAGVVGALVILAIPILGAQAGLTGAEAVPIMGWFFIIATPLLVLLAITRTPETITADVPGGHFQLKEYAALLRRPSLLRLLLADLALSLGPGWMSALYIFYFTDSRSFSVQDASTLLGVYVVAGLAGAPATSRLSRSVGKHVALMITTTAYSIGLVCVLLTPKGNVLATAPVLFWCGFMSAGFNLMTRAMLADVGDEVRLEGGKERVSLLYALTTFTSKLAGACSIGLTFTVLAALGYQAVQGATNTAQAIHGLELAFLIGPTVFVMLGGACFIGYPLDAARHAEIRRQLDERDALYAEAPAVASLGGEAATPDGRP